MDLIAELVLGYADLKIASKIKAHSITDYKIIRYRDDYRIFTNNSRDGEYILKSIAEVMIELGLKLSPAKTGRSDQVILASVKDDKLAWLFRRQRDRNLQKHLLIIHDHSMRHPNSGTLDIALNRFYRRLRKVSAHSRPMPLISIVADIAYQNPRTYPISTAILSKLLSFLKSKRKKKKVIEKIRQRFSQIPNTGHMDIWLQRISYQFAPRTDYDEPLCRLVRKKSVEIWNNDWISSKDLLKEIKAEKIIDWIRLKNMPPIVSVDEVELFKSQYY